MRHKQHGPEVYRITGARQGLTDDVRRRQRRYVISMLIRTLSVVLTVLLWNVWVPLAVVTLVLGGVLPYVAVVVANAGRENAPGLPSTFDVPPERAALAPSHVETAGERPAAPGGAGTGAEDSTARGATSVPDGAPGPGRRSAYG
ncbi:DUF3099 domain-containing protein [Streptomyces sp. GSL17-111]|uniref:DUF3099 domain-containing protein n=1 Tax=Streptomyces sp. GSL17-111 TaxID=3121596 RepID=UPI0030F3EEB7